MARMGSYCKAFHARDFAAFPGWAPSTAALRPADEGEPPRTELKDEDILYLQEDFTVTDGIFLDEHVVFASAAPEWREFCEQTLGFALPPDLADAGDDAPAGTAAAAQS
jgi:hypothetical protein